MPTHYIVHIHEPEGVPPYRTFAYDESGSPLTMRSAMEIVERLKSQPNPRAEIMVLTAERWAEPKTVRRGENWRVEQRPGRVPAGQ